MKWHKAFLSLLIGTLPFLTFFPPKISAQSPALSDRELLETIQRQSLEFFLNERNPQTGLVRDRADNFQKVNSSTPASIAVTGFALTVYGVAVSRHWMDQASARELTRRTLDYFLNRAPNEHGFFYHYLDMKSGRRIHQSEISPIDTALFLAGALFAAEYYQDEKIQETAVKIYERVDWPWMLHGGKTFALSWTPEDGFRKYRWDHYNESLILYLLAIGSPTHPIAPSAWDEILRPVGSYRNYRLIEMPPLFTHQYSHIWIDFRNKHDDYADYFKNSVSASRANHAFCMDQAGRFSTYGPNAWGLTASDGPFGYRSYGAPPGWAQHDGTLAPTGCGSSIVFTPQESMNCLRHFYEDFHDKLWGRYGFSDALNLDKHWFDTEVLGIDQGALILMIENYRTGLIWEIMNRNSYLQKAMKEVHFQPGTKEISWPDPPEYQVPYIPGGIRVDGFMKDWPSVPPIILNASNREMGSIDGDKDLKAEVRFGWDERYLYFFVKVTDDQVIVNRTGKNIWQDDLFELFVDPDGDGLYWSDKKDFQIGFQAHPSDEDVEIWAWFQGDEASAVRNQSLAKGFVYPGGYSMEGAVAWTYLGVTPRPDLVVRASPAVHDLDRDRSTKKVNWFFRSENEFQRFALGKLILEGERHG